MADLRLQIRTSITTREFEKGRIFLLMMINKSKEFSEGQKFYKSSAFNIQKEQKNKKYPSHMSADYKVADCVKKIGCIP